jgi:hypothetical protein
MAPAAGILLFLIAVLVVLFVGSALLRAAVALANKTIGPIRPSASVLWDWEAAEEDEEYARPRRGAPAMPEPGIGQGMLIVFLAGLIQLAVTVAVRIVLDLDIERDLDRGEVLLFAAFSTLVGFGVLAGMTASMLPTTGRRAALAALFFYLIVLALAALIMSLLYAVFGVR